MEYFIQRKTRRDLFFKKRILVHINTDSTMVKVIHICFTDLSIENQFCFMNIKSFDNI